MQVWGSNNLWLFSGWQSPIFEYGSEHVIKVLCYVRK